MDKLRTLSKGAQITLGASGLLFIDSFFSWFKYGGVGFANMWHGLGFIAGLLLLALIAWLVLPIAGIKVEIGLSSSMVTAGLAVLVLLFTAIRFLFKPSSGFGALDSHISRSFFAWLGLLFAIAIVAGAWMSMQAAGESLSDVKAKVSSMTASTGSSGDASAPAPPAPPAPEPPAAPAPPAEEPAAGDGSEHS